MSIRLQVLLPDEEYRQLVKASKKEAKRISELVREGIRGRLKESQPPSPEATVSKILKFAKFNGPTGDINDLLADIEKGRNLKP